MAYWHGMKQAVQMHAGSNRQSGRQSRHKACTSVGRYFHADIQPVVLACFLSFFADALLVKGHMSAGSNTISQAPRLGVPDPACTVGVGILDGVPLKLDYALAGPNESSSGSGTFTLSETSKPSFTGPVNADGFSCELTVNVDGTIRLEQTLPAGIAVNTDIPQCTFTLTGTDSRVPSFNFGRPESNTLSATFNVQGNSFTIVMQSLPRIYALNGPLTESLTARLTGATAGVSDPVLKHSLRGTTACHINPL
jgi:hypothetical protein